MRGLRRPQFRLHGVREPRRNHRSAVRQRREQGQSSVGTFLKSELPTWGDLDEMCRQDEENSKSTLDEGFASWDDFMNYKVRDSRPIGFITGRIRYAPTVEGRIRRDSGFDIAMYPVRQWLLPRKKNVAWSCMTIHGIHGVAQRFMGGKAEPLPYGLHNRAQRIVHRRAYRIRPIKTGHHLMPEQQ